MNLISIITPVYNAGAYIEKTIKSVLVQTYANWEMLIVDDCSTDNTVRIIEQYCELDKRIKLIKHQDRKSTRLNSSHRSLSRMPSSA